MDQTQNKELERKKKLSPKQIKKRQGILRFIIQVIFFVLAPGAYSASFNGSKYILTQIGANQLIKWNSFIAMMIALLAYTIVFGRFFCGYACSFGALGDWLHSIYVYICKKLKAKPYRLNAEKGRKLLYIKYVVLILILFLCYLGIYSKLPNWSPWSLFSMIRSGNFAFAGYSIAIIVFLGIIIGMIFIERFFCRFLCPMGAIFSLMPVLPFLTLHRHREKCIPNCKACTNTCPCGVGLPNDTNWGISGECIACQKCVCICPKHNIHTGLGAKEKEIKGNEAWYVLLRASILLALVIWLGA